ncbi:hypothetical protein M2T79_09290 [Elizabethkingia miricola]|uniref:hypothetical protein n=1 Tax=Elizabethkingia miricola TaxID=172045 RepID=UPI002019D122|nr:hypothetical protein [Elizabethkingia miricola]MCL1656792.1 hypothetical protein [Elizabethkingia miricola]
MEYKTALQELIEKANKFKEVSFTGKLDIDDVIEELNNSLEREKEQITEAYHNGQVIVFNLLKKAFPNYKFPLTQDEVNKIECGLEVNEDAEDYYIEKYNNDTKRKS